MIDVLIAGAGPAGLIVAIRLARAGKSVMIVDKMPPGGHKIGECLPGSVAGFLAKLSLPALQADSHTLINGSISLWGEEMRHQDFLMDAQGANWRLNRQVFEQDLEHLALQSGVEKRADLIHKCEFTGDSWQVESKSGRHLLAKFVIDASGRNRVIARSQGAKRSKAASLVALWGIGQRVTSAKVTDRTLIETAADGWWYGGYLPDNRPVGIFHTSTSIAAQLRQQPKLWRDKLQKSRLIANHIAVTDFTGLKLIGSEASSSCLEQPFGEQWAACGDAALSFDPLSSQGIFNALATGDMLATALLSVDQHSALIEYGQKLRHIYDIYGRRRDALYRSAFEHYQTSFWARQL